MTVWIREASKSEERRALSLLSTNELALEGDVLSRSSGRTETCEYVVFESRALIHVSNPNRFTIRVQPIGGQVWQCWNRNNFQLGIAARSLNFATHEITQSFFLLLPSVDETSAKVLFSPQGSCTTALATSMELPGWDMCKNSTKSLLMEFDNNELRFSFAGENYAKVPVPIPHHDYRPCICINEFSLKLRVAVDPRRRRDSDDEADSPGSKIIRKMWNDHRFADAHVVCGDQTIPVHRSVLAAASSFFERAFDGEMREATSRTVTIEDADPEAVKVLLEYLYTGSFKNHHDMASLLHIAHRLEIFGMVGHCASKLTSQVDERNLLAVVSALRPYREDLIVRPYWNAIAKKVMVHETLVKKLMVWDEI